MSLTDIQFIFNRALSLTFVKKKLLLVFSLLVLCGLLVVFFRALSVNAGQWVLMSLSFLPLFLCAGILLSAGVLLIRIYHDEIKQRSIKYGEILLGSWEVIAGSSYFYIPIILCYLLLWMLLGIFVLLKQVPLVGEFFAVLLSFAPFLINLGSLALAVLSLAMLFLVAPIVALNGLNRIRISQILVNRLKMDPFSNFILGLFAILPLLLVLGLLLLAWVLTGTICYTCQEPAYVALQWFIMMIPFTAVLAPAIIFFFNFSAEAHVLMQRQIKLKQ
jgi:hypothetical protein